MLRDKSLSHEKVIRYLNTIREFFMPGWMRIMGADR